MSSGPAFDAKEQIRQAIDIVDLVGSYLPLRRQGRGFVGLCPWHDDSRPSMQVNPERQIWRCFVCDVGGDIFNFVMKREGVEFREALQMLAERAGIELVQSKNRTPAKPGSPGDKKTLYEAVAWAERQFHEFLLQSPEAETARRYLEERGITPASVERFRIGYGPPRFQWLIDRTKTTSFSNQVLQAVGLTRVSETSGSPYDFFRGRVIFPIRDTQRRVIAFGGRILPEIAEREEKERGRSPGKYVNSPETRLFSKSDHLYALEKAIDGTSKENVRKLIVVEGYTDVIMAHQCGLENVVAVCGTALNERHLRLLRRFADTVTLVLDGDEAGQRRTNQILELFVAADINLRILTLPEGQDPFDLLNDGGAEPFRELLDSASDALQHKIRVETAGIDLAADTHRANQALEKILSTVAKAPRLQSGTEISSRLREHQVLARLSRQFHVPEPELRTRMSQLRRRSKRSGPAETAEAERPDSIPTAESELIEILVLHGQLAVKAIEEIRIGDLSSSSVRSIFTVYGQRLQQDRPVEFSDVLTELTDAGLKSLLVHLQEQAAEKANHTQQPAESRLERLIHAFREKEQDSERRSQLAALEKRTFTEQEELDVFQQLIEQERNRQGISLPTDG